jgi:hypothetical protein
VKEDSITSDQATRSNVFALPNPDSWKCSIWHYDKSHSMLHIQLDHEYMVSRWISFLDVRYFQGTVGWQGANFSKVSPNEYVDFWLEQSRIIDAAVDEGQLRRLASIFSLFIIPTQNIKIVAANGHLSESIPTIRIPTSI